MVELCDDVGEELDELDEDVDSVEEETWDGKGRSCRFSWAGIV